MKTNRSPWRWFPRAVPVLLAFGMLSRGEAREAAYFGRELPASPDWKLEAQGGKEFAEADALVLQTFEPKENRCYRWTGDLGEGKGFQVDLELFIREGIVRLVLVAIGPDGPVQYAMNLYASGLVGAYGADGYRTAKVSGGRIDSVRIQIREGWGSEMILSANDDPKELLVFSPERRKGGSVSGLSLGDSSNSYKTEAVIRRIVIRP